MRAATVMRLLITCSIVMAFVAGTAHSQSKRSSSSNRSKSSSSSAKPPPPPPPICKPHKTSGPPSSFSTKDCRCSCVATDKEGQRYNVSFRGEGGSVACERNDMDCVAHCLPSDDTEAKEWACDQAKALLSDPVCKQPCTLKNKKPVDAGNIVMDFVMDNFPTCHWIVEGECR